LVKVVRGSKGGAPFSEKGQGVSWGGPWPGKKGEKGNRRPSEKFLFRIPGGGGFGGGRLKRLGRGGPISPPSMWGGGRRKNNTRSSPLVCGGKQKKGEKGGLRQRILRNFLRGKGGGEVPTW